jgi:hypothetical protein
MYTGYQVSFSGKRGFKRPERGVDHPHLLETKMKKE